jgi:hypothetical protein
VFAICAANFWLQGLSAIKQRHYMVILIACLVSVLLVANWGFELARDGHVLVQMLGPNGNQIYLPY